jgi:hypothetical protein
MLVSYSFNQQLVLIASQIPSPRWTITKQSIGWISYAVKGQTVFFKYPMVFPWLFSTVVGVQQSNELWGVSMRRYHTVDLTSSRFAESLFPRKAKQTPCITRFRLAVPPWFQGPSCHRSGYPVTLVHIQKFRVKILVSLEFQSLQQLGNFLDFMIFYGDSKTSGKMICQLSTKTLICHAALGNHGVYSCA